MKRLFTIGLMLASAFALTNCSEELVDPDTLTDQVTQDGVNSPESSKGVPFTIYASAGSEADTKTQVVRDENGKTLKTEWVEGDRIYVVYEDKEGKFHGKPGTTQPIEFTVNPDNLQAGEFTGTVPEEVLLDEDNKYNWYFTYGVNLSVDNSGNVTATATIPSVQTQNMTSGKELEHLAINCPMLGKALNLSGSIFPKVQMKHLATLHEVNVQNQTQNNAKSGATPGNIVMRTFGVSTPTKGVWDKSNRVSLTGTYTVNLKNDDHPFTNFGSSSDNITMTLPETGLTIEPNNEYKFYFVTAPIDELQTGATYVKYYQSANGDILTETEYKELNNTSGYTDVTMVAATLYKNTANSNDVITEAQYDKLEENLKKNYKAFATPEIYRQDIFSFIVNGSYRTVQNGKTYTNFKGGVVKRFELPVKELQQPFASDALNIKWSDSITGETDQPVVSFVGATPVTATINGTVRNDVYMVGSEGTAGSIVLKGFAKELFNALPAGFYASRWNNNATAMTLKSVNIWMPEYGDNYQLSGRPALKDYSVNMPMKLQNKYDVEFPLSFSTMGSVMGVSFDNGITRDLLTGDRFKIPASTVTFNGLVEASHFDSDQSKANVVILDENPIYKEISITTVNSFLSKFNDGKGNVATYEGMHAILNATKNSDGTLTFAEDATENARLAAIAEQTAQAIIGKLQTVVGTGTIKKTFLYIFTVEVSLAEAICPGFFTNTTDFMHKMRDMKFEIEIETFPYADSYPTAATPSTKLQPIMFWGFDANAVY